MAKMVKPMSMEEIKELLRNHPTIVFGQIEGSPILASEMIEQILKSYALYCFELARVENEARKVDLPTAFFHILNK